MLCALMEPMYDESDLRQEQLNKSSLLSSAKFLEGPWHRLHFLSSFFWGWPLAVATFLWAAQRRQLVKWKRPVFSLFLYGTGILERWTQHVVRGTGALVVISVLDLLTFALCAPYSETTDGAHFETLLALIAQRGRELFRLLQHPSLSVVKGRFAVYEPNFIQ